MIAEDVMRRVIGFSAWSGTGKTTLMTRIIRILKERGLTVAVVKHDVHGIDACEEGKDSGRFRKAGADSVALIGPEASSDPEAGLFDALEHLSGADIILVEGFKHARIPRVGLRRMAADRPLPEAPETYIAVVTDVPLEAGVPQFRWDEYPELTDFLILYLFSTP